MEFNIVSLNEEKEENETSFEQVELQEMDEEGKIVQKMEEVDENSSGIFGTSFNMINSILGAGVLGLPFSFAEAGFILGLILLSLLGYLTAFSVKLIIRLGKEHNQQTYPDLCKHAMGKFGFYLVPIFMIIFTYGAMLSYVVIIGDTVPVVIRSMTDSDSFFTSRQFSVLLSTFFILIPLCLYKNVSKLAKFSFLAIVALVYIMLLVVINSIVDDSGGKVSAVNRNFFPAIGVISGAYVCHHNTFLLYRSLKENTLKRWGLTTNLSILFSFLLLCSVAVAGNLKYGNDTQGNIFNNLPDDVATNIGRASAAFVLSFTFPIECFVAREAIEIIMGKLLNYRYPTWFDSNRRHIIITLVLIVITAGPGLFINDLGIVFELTGGSSAVALAYIIPALCSLKLDDDEWLSARRILIVLLLVFGVISMFSGTGLTLWNAITAQKDCCIYIIKSPFC